MRTLNTFPSRLQEDAAKALHLAHCGDRPSCPHKVTQGERAVARTVAEAVLRNVPDERSHIVQIGPHAAGRMRAFLDRPNGSQSFGDDYDTLTLEACGGGVLARTSRPGSYPLGQEPDRLVPADIAAVAARVIEAQGHDAHRVIRQLLPYLTGSAS